MLLPHTPVPHTDIYCVELGASHYSAVTSNWTSSVHDKKYNHTIFIPNFHFSEIETHLGLRFDTLLIDCEGCIEHLFNDNRVWAGARGGEGIGRDPGVHGFQDSTYKMVEDLKFGAGDHGAAGGGKKGRATSKKEGGEDDGGTSVKMEGHSLGRTGSGTGTVGATVRAEGGDSSDEDVVARQGTTVRQVPASDHVHDPKASDHVHPKASDHVHPKAKFSLIDQIELILMEEDAPEDLPGGTYQGWHQRLKDEGFYRVWNAQDTYAPKSPGWSQIMRHTAWLRRGSEGKFGVGGKLPTCSEFYEMWNFWDKPPDRVGEYTGARDLICKDDEPDIVADTSEEDHVVSKVNPKITTAHQEVNSEPELGDQR